MRMRGLAKPYIFPLVNLVVHQMSSHNHVVLAVVEAIVRHLKLTQETIIIGE
jgi:hypothetical protein